MLPSALALPHRAIQNKLLPDNESAFLNLELRAGYACIMVVEIISGNNLAGASLLRGCSPR
jgi:hypothetical protein